MYPLIKTSSRASSYHPLLIFDLMLDKTVSNYKLNKSVADLNEQVCSIYG